MQISVPSLVSPTYSINDQAINLNSSSVTSSASCALNGPLVSFEEYIDPSERFKQKKHLRIEIDEEFDFGQNTNQVVLPSKPKEKILDVKQIPKDEHFRELQSSNEETKHLIDKLEAEKHDLARQNEALKASLKKKEETMQGLKSRNDELLYKLAHLEEVSRKEQFYDEKLREKESSIKEWIKLYEKSMAMNMGLQKESRENQRKILELERDLQKTFCNTQFDNLTKIKEANCKLKQSFVKPSLGKENAVTNPFNCVKSLERRKAGGSQIKKAGRIGSTSTINLAKKAGLK